MASTILYKFRSGTTFEALPLPGTSARLLDVKRAIVQAKKLDGNAALEFDLSVKDANTNQEYVDESMLLPRGTRVIVQRLPAARGHGLLSRLARAASGMSTQYSTTGVTAPPSGFYTITSRNAEEEDEFVPTGVPAGTQNQSEKELAALMAVTQPAAAASASATGGLRPTPTASFHRPAGSGPPPPRGNKPPSSGHYAPRPNADPELRDQDRMPKKRATGIPRTFLNLASPPVTDGTTGEGAEDGGAVARLQPNAIGFEELVNRGGGQSENLRGTKRDLDYALKLTSTSIPEHLQCGICHGVVKNAMLLPWDVEGRTACENCIRDALTQNGFQCPLTGMEGVSPDDLHPNHGLRKAAELFVQGVMEKVDEIDQQQVEDQDEENEPGAAAMEGDAGDKGVIVSRKSIGKSRKDDDDPFGGGDDDFGGDVFDVQADDPEEDVDESAAADATETEKEAESNLTTKDATKESDKTATDDPAKAALESKGPAAAVEQNDKPNKSSQSQPQSTANGNAVDKDSGKERPSPHQETSAQNRREARTRGPPAGYASGPAGGAAVRGGPNHAQPSPYASSRGGRGPPSTMSSPPQADHGSYRGGGGRGPGGRQGRFYNGGRHSPQEFDGRGGGRGGFHRDGRSPRHDEMSHGSFDDDDSRGTKRPRSGSDDAHRGRPYGRFDHPRGRGGPYRGGGRGGGRGDYGGGRFGGRGGYPRGRGGYGGGRGRY